MSNKYPDNWPKISEKIREKNGYKCERCHHPNDPATGHTLTIHHLDGHKDNSAEYNLACLCQKCHLHIQHKVKLDQMLFDFYEISDWFKPHLDGFLNERIKT